MPINPFLEKSSVSTMIAPTKGNKFFFMRRLHMQMSMDYVERARYHVFEDISKKCQDLTPMVIDCAKHYYVDLSKRKLSRGNIRKGLIACCIYYACKKNNVSRSIKEIACICEITPAVLNTANKIFQDIMSDVIETSVFNDTTKVDNLVNRFLSNINIDRSIAFQLSKEVSKINSISNDNQLFIGKTPSAVTSAIILYVLKKQNISFNKKASSIQLNVSIVTLNKLLNILTTNSSLF